jgi:hypothetical protein
MELKLKVFTEFNNNHSTDIGEITLLNNEFVKLKEEVDNCAYLNFINPGTLPIKRNTYTIKFLDKYHENYKGYNLSIQIRDSFLLFAKINWHQKIKLKWMNKQYWIQKGNNVWLL